MANEEHLAILRQGVEAWNRWRWENEGVRPDVSGASLSGASLSGANLSGATLERATLSGAVLSGATLERATLSGATLIGADLSYADLSRADLSYATLSGADLSGADLTWASLTWARLSYTNLNRADLSRANLNRADLSYANLNRAIFGSTVVGAVDLRDVRGLDTVRHRGPSTIGLDTIDLSQGQIPESFLCGCGVSDALIDAITLHTTKPIQFYSCFISYSSKDEALAQRLYADLQAQGVRCWFAPHDIKTGESIIDSIDQAIRLHEKLLLILSESAVGSAWVGLEVKTAIMREQRESRRVLFPIRLDDAVMQSVAGWAGQVQERQIGDFRQWKDHDAYQAAFTRLLRDLKATPDR